MATAEGSGSVPVVSPLEADLASCLKIAEFLFEERPLDEFLRLVLNEAVSRMDADRGSIFLIDRARDTLVGFAMTGVALSDTIEIERGKGIVSEAIDQCQVLNIRNAYLDDRFFKGVDAVTGYKTRAILCAPIVSHICRHASKASQGNFQESTNLESSHGEVWGALEILNPKNKECFDACDEQSLRHLLAFAGLRLKEHSNLATLISNQERLETEVARVRGFSDETNALKQLVGKSAEIDKLKQMIWSVAPFDSNVLVHGESGTGKELVAHCVHALSGRAKKPFVAINCAAIPESLQEAELFGIESGVATGVSKRAGRIEQANGGTLFLDEIGEMSLQTQAKMLRALQEREIVRLGGKDPIKVDIRVVAATHRNLQDLIVQKYFREDLYYRLNVVQIKIPALRDRKSDVAMLGHFFLERLNVRYKATPPKTFSQGTLAFMTQAEWPGNVRQLQNEVERMFVVSGTNPILHHEESGTLPSSGSVRLGPGSSKNGMLLHRQPSLEMDGIVASEGDAEILSLPIVGKSLSEILEEAEQLLVRNSLQKHAGNKSRVAESLGISREGLRKMLTRWGEK